MTAARLPQPLPGRVLALGAYLKNAACAVDGADLRWSANHGDLGDPAACLALEASAERLLDALPEGPQTIAHDLHPDFHSTRLAQALADRLGVPALAVQHHHAHLAVVAAEHGVVDEPLVGWALDGVGLGSDGSAWGGELLWLDAASRSTAWRRLAHLPALALPGGDRAAREPWRMAAALLDALGRGDEIVPRLGPSVGEAAAATVQQMLAKGLNCPRTTAGGRWFDAAAAALGVHRGVQAEAEAAIALEAEAARWLATQPAPAAAGPRGAQGPLDALPAAVGALFDVAAARRGEAAARFHALLADALAGAAIAAARAQGARLVALGGGCFFNRVLSQRVEATLRDAGLRVLRPGAAGCGDAGLALGQAWIAAWARQHGQLTEPVPDAALLGA
ncbi:MAG TPA: carbamoyltransferase HypF [Rubrivivax sp.]|nr:carbamoyltransferase HypF [Rubrivivax sp.]